MPAAADPDLMQRLAEQLGSLREDSRRSLLAWLVAAERGEGGQLVMQAPHGRRDLVEVGFRSESWSRLAT